MLVALLKLHAKAWHGSRTLSCRILALIVEIVQNNFIQYFKYKFGIVLVHHLDVVIAMILINFMISFFLHRFFGGNVKNMISASSKYDHK